MTDRPPALDAAFFADALLSQLLLAGATTLPADERREALARAFENWPKLCRRMAVLEDLEPRITDAGYREDEKLVAAMARVSA